MDTTKLNRSVATIAATAAVIAGGLGATAMSASASAGPGIGGGLVGLSSTVTLAPGQSTSGIAEFYNPTVGVAETATVSVGGSYIAASPTSYLAATGQAGDQSASQRSTITISVPASAKSGTYTDYVQGQVPPVAGGNIGVGIKLPITVIVSAPKAGLNVTGSGGSVTVKGRIQRAARDARPEHRQRPRDRQDRRLAGQQHRQPDPGRRRTDPKMRTQLGAR